MNIREYEADTLFDALTYATGDGALSLQHRYETFHALNPNVMRAIERVADEWVAAGGTRLGMGAIFEQLRWRSGLVTQGSAWKLDNNWRSRYTRDLIARRPDIAGLFVTRELRAA